MPKHSAQEKIEFYRHKIRRLERRIIYSSSDSSDGEENDNTPQNIPIEEDPPTPAENPPTLEQDPPTPVCVEPVIQPDPTELVVAVNADQAMSELNADILVALGAKTDEVAEYGEKIHENLSQLWTPILRKGVQKDDKDKLIKEYPTPQNCRMLQAPKLNAEISAAVPEAARSRDKKIGLMQQQLGAGITAVNRAMDALINTNDQLKAIKFLSDSCRILCDLHHANTTTRIKLITPGLDKQFINVIQDASRDETLFGNELPEKIKACKAIEKQGLQIKKNPPPPPAVPSTSTARPPQHRGNWAWPPRYPLIKMTRGGPKRTPSYNYQGNYHNHRANTTPAAQAKPASKTTPRAHSTRR